MRIIFSVFAWIGVSLATVLFSLLSVLCSVLLRPVDPDLKIPHLINSVWARSIFFLNPVWRLKVRGRGYLKERRGYVLVSNHASMSDIICLFLLGKQFKWVSKESLFQIPFLGWAMTAAGYVRLERGKHGSIRESYEESIDWLRKNMPILIFPEGTRSRNGRLGAFKNGAFKLAVQTQKPIVPIVLSGTRTVLEKGNFLFSPSVRCTVKILKPIPTEGYNPSDFHALRDLVRTKMLGALGES